MDDEACETIKVNHEFDYKGHNLGQFEEYFEEVNDENEDIPVIKIPRPVIRRTKSSPPKIFHGSLKDKFVHENIHSEEEESCEEIFLVLQNADEKSVDSQEKVEHFKYENCKDDKITEKCDVQNLKRDFDIEFCINGMYV